jgi:predicted dehydrogenase
VPPETAALAAQLGAELQPPAQALARPDVDLVVIAKPTETQLALIRVAARAGKQIICEKPLARTLDQAQAILDVVAQTGVKLAVGHVVRYFPDYAMAHNLIVRGELGTPGVARATRGSGFPSVPNNWFADVARSGGVALDLMIHDFDWLRWTFGPVERLYARGLTYAGRAGKDAAMVIMRFRSGALAYVEGNWAYPGGFRTTLEVSGSAGLIRTASREHAPLTFEMAPTSGPGVAVPTGGLSEDPYLAQMRDFVGWMGGGSAPRCSAEDGFEALRISLAALECIDTGQPAIFAS